MRTIPALGLAFALASVPAAQAQQIAAPASAEQVVPDLIEVPLPRMAVDPAPTPEIRAQQETAQAGAAREVSARTVLAIVGGLLIVVALIAFLL
jgi:hypothetical protein